jgi:SM-20-related protein
LTEPRKPASQIAAELGETGISICERFFSPAAVLAARLDMTEIMAEGRFHRAGVGHGQGFEIRDSVRRDEICWLNRDNSSLAQESIWTEFDTLKTAFNQTLYLGLNQFEGHYANYESGGFYQRHLDSFADSNLEEDSRMISLIVYLNENWQPQDGGELRLYSENSHIDVAPTGGTLVCFMSREFEHEVLKSHARRVSFAGWFGRRRQQPQFNG